MSSSRTYVLSNGQNSETDEAVVASVVILCVVGVLLCVALALVWNVGRRVEQRERARLSSAVAMVEEVTDPESKPGTDEETYLDPSVVQDV